MLLSNMMRAQAITGRTDLVNQWLGGRQFGRWSQRPPAKQDPDASLKMLREQGVIDDAEYETLRKRIKSIDLTH
jgi:hypothetical protein